MIAIHRNGDADIDFNGLCAILKALSASCACETELPREECIDARLDRWWIPIITGRAAEDAD